MLSGLALKIKVEGRDAAGEGRAIVELLIERFNLHAGASSMGRGGTVATRKLL
jgi:hypothetical protein